MSPTVTAGLDGSPESLAATQWAAQEALRRAVPLRLLRVGSIDEDPRTRVVDRATAREWGERTLAIAERRLRRRHPGLDVDTAWVAGDPVEELCGAAEEAELLVLGSRGLGGLAGFLAGSVSLAVLARTRRPVVLVRPHDLLEPQEERTGEVVIGLDVSAAGDELLDFGFAAADRYGCGLRVVHRWAVPALYGPDMGGALPLLMTEAAADTRRALDEALAPWTEKFPDVAVVRDCRQGRPAQDLMELSHDARLVVVGRKVRRARIGTHVGAVTHAVLHHCLAPVAVVPHD
ncbi:universal stress protein [Streptomyces antimicrobicus]|uniref:Universal stress protein n=1 Tax=Streptomyces antimicrobicus TaxID=2883108 RepID=A0ABS8B115_9ACTN|nr:universal stress protein [Streptomyces antimicrobicus]MCB5178262.1 universal stress protein [Streptomyces antimicrobicus]